VVLPKSRRFRFIVFGGGNAVVSSLHDLAIYEAPIIDHVPNEYMLGSREVRRHLRASRGAAVCACCALLAKLERSIRLSAVNNRIHYNPYRFSAQQLKSAVVVR
jgi:hypothetical protein